MRNIGVIICLLFIGFIPYSQAQSNGFEEVKNLELIDLIYQQLDKYFVDNPKVGKITKVGIDAMLNELDPYTVYYPESNIEDYRLMTTGQYGGIGALIRKIDDYVVIAEPYEEMPAQKAGLKAGDRILSIDGIDMEGMDTEIVSKALKGPKESSVKIEFDRPGKGKMKAKVERDEIKVPDIPYAGMIDEENKIGYINLSSFTKTASKNVKKEFKNLKEEGMKSLVFDLRGNGGGLLVEAINIVNIFVPEGEKIVETKGRVADENKVYRTQHEPLDTEIPVVVLVDGHSASASEIVSGSLQDLDRGVVVGRNTFGKGLVQRTMDLKYGAKMKLTTAKYYTPSGRCVQKLDYYHKHEGQVEEVPDSLITIFHTKNGREVIDGRGVDPDVEIESKDYSRLTAILLTDNIVFNYATKFFNEHESIDEPGAFDLSDEQFEDFKSFALEQDFEYKSATQHQLEELLEIAKKEGYDVKMKSEYEALHDALDVSKQEDMDLFKDQIKELLSDEIISRYYYQKGRVLNSFREDEALKKAKDILQDKEEYDSILNP